MRTEELEEYMLRDPYISQYFGGVVALDQLPKVIKKPSMFIVNTDPSSLPGRHWLVVFFTRINEHFDSAGFYPIKPQSVRISLDLHNSRVTNTGGLLAINTRLSYHNAHQAIV